MDKYATQIRGCGQQSAPATKDGEIQQEFDALEKNLIVLRETVQHFIARVGPVLRPSPPTGNIEERKDDHRITPLAARLQSLRLNLEATIRMITDATDRVGL